MEKNSDEEMMESLKKDLVVHQKLETEKVVVKREQITLVNERLEEEKERIYNENERFIKLFETNKRRLEM